MDATGWILFIALSLVVAAIIVGLIDLLAKNKEESDARFAAVVIKNEELDKRLNLQLDKSISQIMLERELYKAIGGE